jgi:hypothetical protein
VWGGPRGTDTSYSPARTRAPGAPVVVDPTRRSTISALSTSKPPPIRELTGLHGANLQSYVDLRIRLAQRFTGGS